MNAGPPPNYYAILGLSETASTSQIRDAYKRAALKTHPDRVPAGSPDRAERTRKFQLVNDAYYTLSDASRRRDYDAQRKLYGQSSTGNSMPGGADFGDDDDDDAFSEANVPGGMGGAQGGPNAFSWAWNFFTGQGADSRQRAEAEEAQFGDAFDEMMREEGVDGLDPQRTRSFWSTLGGASGGVLGYIIGNVPGAVAGAVAGNRIGAVRDARGKSVYSVFQELPQDDRAKLLSQLAAKVLSHAVGA
ncbi:DnaJ-domain-containing protein [Thozetella sp. PMI_491]|nr:DnaJ-domain-containing protein [Thozetella sp. PMI_491]